MIGPGAASGGVGPGGVRLPQGAMPGMKPLTPEIEHSRATVKRWERMRVLYNLAMLLAGGVLIWRVLHLQGQPNVDPGVYRLVQSPLELVAFVFVFGFVANICYCLGPYAEFVLVACGFAMRGKT